MKKVIISLLIALMVVLVPFTVKAKTIGEVPEVTDHEKVTIHLFYASWCPHCHDFITYFSDKYEDYADYFEIKTYLVSELGSDNNTVSIPENSKIMDAVMSHFKKDNEGNDLTGGIPLIIIGSSFVQAGFGEDGAEIIEKALEEYQNKKYEDVVSKLIKDKKLDTSKVEEFSSIAEEVAETEDSGVSAWVIIGIFVVLIGGFAGLVVAGKK